MAGARVAQTHPGHRRRFAYSQDFLDDAVPDDADLRIAEQPLLQDLFRSERVAAMDQSDLPRVVRQINRLLDRGIAAADDHDILAAEKEPVASRAG